MPFNDEVSFWREIKDYLYTEDVLVRWSENPSVRCYFVTMGEWNGNPQHEDSIRRFKQDLTNDFSEVHFHFFGGSDIKEALDRNENQLTAQLPYVDTIAFPGVTDVDGSCIILCQANEYIQMLDTKEGIIRKSLFNDNVRDFQGENNINNEKNKYDLIIFGDVLEHLSIEDAQKVLAIAEENAKAIMIAVVPTIIVYCIFSNQIVDGLTAGAVKG